MKELSIEEKARAYDKALAIAKEQLNGAKVFNYDNEQVAHDIRTTVYNIFPELKESEDERIRKQIISFLKEFEYDHYRCLDFSSWIAWLEKQGEQKPVDKVESIFEVDNWVVANEKKYTFLVKRGAPRYQVEDTNGDIYSFYLLPNGEKEYHLWTIEDAKDGDVLCLGGVIAIFKKYIGQEKCICYCSFCDNGGFEIPIENGEDNVYGCTDTTPATKEQRDLLFAKMHEAGYDWKKKLIKL